MKKYRVITCGVALMLLSSTAALARGGADDSSSGSSVSSPTPTPQSGAGDNVAGSGSSSGGSPGSGGAPKGSSSPEVERIDSVGVANDEAPNQPEAQLSNDTSDNEVRLELKGGKAVEVTTSGGVTKSEQELKGGEAVVVDGVDSGGKKHKIRIKVSGNNFRVLDGAAEADAHFPLVVDPKTDTLSVVTPAGTVAVKVLPANAIDDIESAGALSEVDSTEFELGDGTTSPSTSLSTNPTPAPTGTEVDLVANGVKNVKFLGVFPVSAQETVGLNVQTGALKSETKPWFLNLFGFLFSGK